MFSFLGDALFWDELGIWFGFWLCCLNGKRFNFYGLFLKILNAGCVYYAGLVSKHNFVI